MNKNDKNKNNNKISDNKIRSLKRSAANLRDNLKRRKETSNKKD
jgi:hypothetical protein